MTLLIWLTFIAAAVLEVGGDALIRKGLRGSSAAFIVGGCLMLSCYGVAVNIVKWDFSNVLMHVNPRDLGDRSCQGVEKNLIPGRSKRCKTDHRPMLPTCPAGEPNIS